MNKSVNIIGGGIGGLTAAAMLAKKGMKVRLFERLPKVGGAVDSFSRKGYNFEASSHQLALLDQFRELYRELGLKEGPEPHYENELYNIFYINSNGNKEYLTIPTGVESCKKMLIEKFPQDERAINSLFKIFRGINRDFIRISSLGRIKLNPLFIYDALTALMLAKGREGGFIQSIGKASYSYLVKYFKQSWHEILAPFNISERLYSILSQAVLYLSATPSNASGFLMSALIYNLLVNRPYLFKEGSHSVINVLKRAILENGGEILCKQSIERIKVESGRVEALYNSNGEEYRADYTISAICSYTTFFKLIGEGAVEDRDYLERIKGEELSDSSFTVYVGIPGTLESYGFKPGTTFFNFDNDIERATSIKVPSSGSNLLFSDYSYLNKGEAKTSFALLELDSYERWEKIPYHSDEYFALKKETENRLLEKFERATGIPVRERAEIILSASPHTNRYYMGNRKGEIIGLRMTADQIMTGRLPAATPLENLFLAGHYVQPCSGVAAALSSGMTAAREILKRR